MRLSQGPATSFQAPAAVRQFSSGSQVYLFRSERSESEESSEEEEELEAMELRARGKERQQRNAASEKVGDVVFLEREVGEDDSLNKLALQYGCKVADIKRVNNFMREQDLYALKSIRIPVKVNGVLTEARQELPNSATVSPAEWLEGNDGGNREPIDQYFRGIDENIEQAAQVVQATVSPSPDYCIETPGRSPSRPKGATSGADCGIQWWNAVFAMLLVGIILPVFYIVYFKTQKLDVAGDASNVTANDSLHGLAVHVPKAGTFILTGG